MIICSKMYFIIKNTESNLLVRHRLVALKEKQKQGFQYLHDSLDCVV